MINYITERVTGLTSLSEGWGGRWVGFKGQAASHPTHPYISKLLAPRGLMDGFILLPAFKSDTYTYPGVE